MQWTTCCARTFPAAFSPFWVLALMVQIALTRTWRQSVQVLHLPSALAVPGPLSTAEGHLVLVEHDEALPPWLWGTMAWACDRLESSALPGTKPLCIHDTCVFVDFGGLELACEVSAERCLPQTLVEGASFSECHGWTVAAMFFARALGIAC